MLAILSYIPGAHVIDPNNATLLGSPLDYVSSISSIIDEKIKLLINLGTRLQQLFSHDAILILRHSFAFPKLIYIFHSFFN